MNRPTLSLIAAVSRNGAIGADNALVWSEPEDRKHLRRVTMGFPVIMGRRTWDSLPARFRPLPGRRNIVVTRDRAWRAEGAESVASIEEACALLNDAQKAFVIGGAEIYALALPMADELVLTEIDADLVGDTFFPTWDRARFVLVTRESHVAQNGVHFSFATYKTTGGT